MAPSVPNQDISNLAGTHLGAGKYLLEERIGSGSMGHVYRAKHLELQRTVAVKILKPSILQRPKAAERFRREARAASMLQHRNTVQLLDFGREGNLLYIVMEFLDGVSLDKLLDERKTLTLNETIDAMGQICAAISAAHDQGILHRDIKPENIILIPGIDDDGRQCMTAKVCDFGIAKIVGRGDQAELTGVHEVWGTPNAMSPEQAQGLPLDQRSDVYSLGILLYQMCTGRVPFTGRTPVEIMGRHVKEPPTPPSQLVPDVNKDLEAVILKSLAKAPADRQPSARALRAELRDVLQLGSTMSELIPIVELTPDDGVEEDATVVQPGGFGFSSEALRNAAARATGKPAFDEPETPRELEAPPQAQHTDRTPRAQRTTGRGRGLSALARSQRLLLVAIAIVSLLLILGVVGILTGRGEEKRHVQIASVPTGATIHVNGDEVGTTPASVEMGTQATVVVSLRGYAPWTGSATDLKDGSSVDVTLERTLELADIVVNSDPVGADVIVDGTFHSTDTPTVVTGLWVGMDHQLVVTKAGYEPILERVSFATEDLVRLAVAMRATDAAYVYGWCEEPGCDVRVDGKVVGNTASGPIEVAADSALVVELLQQGNRVLVREVLLEPGRLMLLTPDGTP